MPTVYEIVTQTIIEKLEAGEVPWRKPWITSAPKNLVSGKEYRGVNTFLLSASGFPSPYWLTYAQAAKLGGNVKRGEHGQIVVFWNVGQEKLNPKNGKIQKPFLLRYYRVFNLSQCEHDGEPLAEKLGLVDEASKPVPSVESCDAMVSGMPNRPAIKASDRAWYRPSTDEVGIPDKAAFNSSEAFYATLFHELTHSTGHVSRVRREGIEQLNSFGSESYSKEELIAEMGAAMLCGCAGIAPAILKTRPRICVRG